MSIVTPVKNDYVSDTMAVVLRLEGRKLGPGARAAYELAESGGGTIFILAISLAEIMYLSARKPITTTLADVIALFNRSPQFKEFPLGLGVIQMADQIDDIPELHDRLIAATGHFLQIPVITNDPVLEKSAWVQTVW